MYDVISDDVADVVRLACFLYGIRLWCAEHTTALPAGTAL